MSVRFTDDEIRRLIEEPKPLSPDYRSRLQVRQKHGHREREVDVVGVSGGLFRILLRQSSFNPLDFSAILMYLVPNTNQQFRLRRYNGKSHEHTNTIEGERFYDFHMHMATERYQALDKREDTYAVLSDRHTDLTSAIACLIADCACHVPPASQQELFEPEES